MFIHNIRNKAIPSQCCLVSTMHKNVIYAIIATMLRRVQTLSQI